MDHTQLQGFDKGLQSLPAFYEEHFKMLWGRAAGGYLYLCLKAPESEMLQLEVA